MSLRKKTRTLNALWSNLFLLHKESYAQALSKHYTCNMLQTFAKRLMLVADFIPSSSFLKRRSEFVENLAIFLSKLWLLQFGSHFSLDSLRLLRLELGSDSRSERDRHSELRRCLRRDELFSAMYSIIATEKR